jgi:hypothetical protein
MIGLLVKIPFFGQIKKAEPRLAAQIRAAIEDAARASAAKISLSDEPAFLSFDDRLSPGRLRAAEAGRLLVESLKALGPRLHGWCLILDSCLPGEEEDLRHFKRLWYGIRSDGFFLGPNAENAFERYFSTSQTRDGSPGGKELCIPILQALHAHPALPNEALPPAPSGPFLERVIDELGALGIGNSPARALVILGPERAPIEVLNAGLDYLYGPKAKTFLRFRSSTVSSSPYGPLLEGFSILGDWAAALPDPLLFLSKAELVLFNELKLILDFLSRSPFRAAYSAALDVRLRICTMATLRLYARERRTASLPAFVILEGIDRFSPVCLALSRLFLEETLFEEGVSVIALGSKMPEQWPLDTSRRLDMPAGAKPEGFRLGAQLWTKARIAGETPSEKSRGAVRIAADTSIEELARITLSDFPCEYAELLYALSLGEEVLRDDDMDSFLDSMGYVLGMRTFMCAQLSALGFLTEGKRPRIASATAAKAAQLVLEDTRDKLRVAFAERLLALHAQRRIIASQALYRRIGNFGSVLAAPSSLGFFLDCATADALYGPSEPGADKPDSPLAAYAVFLDAYAAGDGKAAELALSELEAGTRAAGASVEDRLASDMVSLSRAALEYAAQNPASAANKAKNALIDLHALGAQQSEARAHRILGLCALAQGQVQEGADYLANAFEIAESVGSPLCSILSAQAESAAYLVLGDIGRAQARTAVFVSRASTSFRSDWEMAGAFMEGRIAFELGAYAAAEEAFGRVRVLARVYRSLSAALRAEIWIGRAASCAGETERARSLLARGGDDPEALWFLAELEHWEGRRLEAASLIESAARVVSHPGFASADVFDWSSGFASIEGRAVGFAAGRSYAADQIAAFRDYCAALNSPTQARERAERLALQAREERLALTHPSIHLYLFYRYLILKEIGSGPMDAASVLSKAFKALQIRAGRMNDAVQKSSFMEKNRWNREILAEARRHKLI